jgi:hypothetical protein
MVMPISAAMKLSRTMWIGSLAVVGIAMAVVAPPPPGPEVPALVQPAAFSVQHGPQIKALDAGGTYLQQLVEHIAPEYVRPDGLTAEIMLVALDSLRDVVA